LPYGKSAISGTKSLILLASILVIVVIVVSLLNFYLYRSRLEKFEAEKIENLFEGEVDFAEVAKNILNGRADVAYVKLVDESGVLEESFGNGDGIEIEEITVVAPDNKTITVGFKTFLDQGFIIYTSLLSILVGSVVGGILLLILIKSSSDENNSLERLISALRRVSNEDFSTRLEIDESLQDDVTMIRVYDNFNQMVKRLQMRGKVQEVEEPGNFQPKVVVSEDEETSKLRGVTAFVTKISNFNDLSAKDDTVGFATFLTEYRKKASTIISDYNGTIEALLQEEIVALFNAPDEQDKPELRAVCAAVEVLQVLASMNKQRKHDGKEAIGGKIGIVVKPIQFYIKSGIPRGVKNVITEARDISTNAGLWKIMVSEGIYEIIRDHVEVKGISEGDKLLYSIVSVEEGIVNIG